MRYALRFHSEQGTPGVASLPVDEAVIDSLPLDGTPDGMTLSVSQEEYDSINQCNRGAPVDKRTSTTTRDTSDRNDDGAADDYDEFGPRPRCIPTPRSPACDRGDDDSNEDADYEPRPHYIPPPMSSACEEVTVRCLLEGKDPLVHYPKIEGTPYSEYDTPFLLTYLFPHLFPGGQGDPTDPCRARPVKLKDAIAHLIHVRYDDPDCPGGYLYPFAEEAGFVFYTGNLLHRQAIIEKTHIYFKRNPEHSELTLQQARSMASNGTWSDILRKIGKYTGDVLMSPDYWWKKRGLMTSLRDTVGAFDAFYTFSYCERYDPYLLRLYGDPRLNKIKTKIPHFLTSFYGQRLESFRKHWTFGVMGCKALWERDEYQQRDFRHSHGMLKLRSNLKMQELHCKIVAGVQAAQHLEKEAPVDDGKKLQLLQIVQDGKDAEPKLVRALDILSSHNHPNGVQPFVRPTTHPCSRSYVNVVDQLTSQERENHFSNLHSMCGLHYKCTSYCLRRQKDGSMRCKMHFGDDDYKPISTETKFTFHAGPGGQPRLRVIYERNNTKTNNINKSQFYGWGHNTDFQVCNDEQAADDYAAKYSSKGVTRSRQWEAAADIVMKYADPTDKGRRLLIKTILHSHKGLIKGYGMLMTHTHTRRIMRLYMSPTQHIFTPYCAHDRNRQGSTGMDSFHLFIKRVSRVCL